MHRQENRRGRLEKRWEDNTGIEGDPCTVELQWLEHLLDYENLFETGVVRAIEGLL